MVEAEQRVAVTGLGAVSPNGVGVRAFAGALRAGRSGLWPVGVAHEQVKAVAAGRVTDWQPSEADTKRQPRLVPMAMAAAREAVGMAQLGGQADPQRVGLMLGSGGGGIDFTVDQAMATGRGGRPSLWTITNATHGNLAGELSIGLGLRGPSHCVSTGCTSSSDALGTAMLHLQAGRCDAVVVGGADAHIKAQVLWPMQLLGCLSTGAWENPQHASRPFDRDRDGFVLGEGAWFVVLERSGFAEARGARVLAELAGYGSTCDAYHRVRPDPQPTEAARAITQAIEQAQIQAGDIDYIHYHGTGTRINDVVETRAMRLALGAAAEATPGSSVKSMIGHPQGACGAAAVVATIAAQLGLDGGGAFLPPTVNLDAPDPECDLDYIPHRSRDQRVGHALVNCLAFGAKNSALVLRF